MLDKLAKPTLLDFLYVAHHMGAEQREQYKVLTGREFDADTHAAEVFTGIGPRWVYPDEGGVPICIGGFRNLGPGAWADWLITRDDAWEKHAKSVTQVCRATIELMLTTEARRVQAICQSSRSKVRAWYRLIGYEHEGTIRSLGVNGEDFEMYARVR